MLTKTTEGYFYEEQPFANLLGEAEAIRLTRYLNLMGTFSDRAQAIINERSFDVCVIRGVISVPPDFEVPDLEF